MKNTFKLIFGIKILPTLFFLISFSSCNEEKLLTKISREQLTQIITKNSDFLRIYNTSKKLDENYASLSESDVNKLQKLIANFESTRVAEDALKLNELIEHFQIDVHPLVVSINSLRSKVEERFSFSEGDFEYSVNESFLLLGDSGLGISSVGRTAFIDVCNIGCSARAAAFRSYLGTSSAPGDEAMTRAVVSGYFLGCYSACTRPIK